MKTEFKLNRQKINQAELKNHQNFDDKGNERCKILKIEN